MTPTPTPNLPVADGIYHDVPDSDYRLWVAEDGSPRLSKSRIEHAYPANASPSMAGLKAAVDGQYDSVDTPALFFGRAFDTRILQPDLFKQIYAALPKLDKRTKAGKESLAQWEQQNEGKIALPAEGDGSMAQIQAMAHSVYQHDIVHMIRQAGGEQSSLAWHDEHTEVPMRCRTDKITLFRNTHAVIDIKTALAIDDQTITSQISRYGYHRQGAIYTDGYLALTRSLPDFLLVFVCKKPPYEVRVERLGPPWISLGRKQYRSVLHHWKKSVKSDNYAGAYSKIHELIAPKWVETELEHFGGID